MPVLKLSNILRLAALASVLFSVRAFAQFEVAPDHCDDDQSQNVRSTTTGNHKPSVAKATARVRPPQTGSTPVPQKFQMAKQPAVAAQFRGAVLTIYQHELDRLRSLLASVVDATEATLARVPGELDIRLQLATSLHPAAVTVGSSQTLH